MILTHVYMLPQSVESWGNRKNKSLHPALQLMKVPVLAETSVFPIFSTLYTFGQFARHVTGRCHLFFPIYLFFQSIKEFWSFLSYLILHSYFVQPRMSSESFLISRFLYHVFLYFKLWICMVENPKYKIIYNFWEVCNSDVL